MDDFAPDATALAEAIGLPVSDGQAMELARRVHVRVRDKLQREAVEDFRLDYEDGYGVRPDAEEDGHAVTGAQAVARAMRERLLSPFIGIRVKPLTAELHGRSLRTLDLFLSALVRTAGHLPDNFFITLPKISAVEQVTAFVDALEQMEARLALAAGTLRFEAMVETPQLIIDGSGRSLLPSLIDAGRGRLTAAHFGTYDYTASLNITAAYQRMRHVACDFARSVMQVALAGTGVWLSDGSTTVMPVPIHRRAADGPALTERQVAENRVSVHNAWRMHYDDVRHSLESGFYQGWDLHPAQLVTRYAAVYAFFLTGLEQQGARLRNFVERAAQATLVGDVFDDAATGQGLLNFFFRAINCGAVTEEEAVTMTGVTLDELRGRSFVPILQNRRGGSASASA
jgi:citrate lyase beta subunit